MTDIQHLDGDARRGTSGEEADSGVTIDGAAPNVSANADAAMPGAAGADAGGIAATTLEALLERRTSRRRRAFQLASLGLALVGGVALLAQQLLFARSQPMPPAPIGAGPTVIVDANTTWGTLTLNGKRLSGPPPQFVTLAAGGDTLILNVPPFATETCQIIAAGDDSAPPTVERGPCVTELPPASAAVGSARAAAAHVTFLVGGGALTSADLAAAQVALAGGLSVLQQQMTVAPGAYFASGFDVQGNAIDVRAPAPLTARLTVTLDPTPRDIVCGPLDCGTRFGATPAGAGQVWSLQVALRLRWSFFDARGAPVGAVDYDVPSPFQTYLTYGGTSVVANVGTGAAAGAGASNSVNVGASWRLAQADGSPATALDIAPASLCGAGSEELGSIGRALLSVRSVRGTLTQGCLIQMQSQDGTAEGLYLWTFGALLAADAQAHRLLPTLPIAPAAAVAAAAAAPNGSGLGSSR